MFLFFQTFIFITLYIYTNATCHWIACMFGGTDNISRSRKPVNITNVYYLFADKVQGCVYLSSIQLWDIYSALKVLEVNRHTALLCLYLYLNILLSHHSNRNSRLSYVVFSQSCCEPTYPPSKYTNQQFIQITESSSSSYILTSIPLLKSKYSSSSL